MSPAATHGCPDRPPLASNGARPVNAAGFEKPEGRQCAQTRGPSRLYERRWSRARRQRTPMCRAAGQPGRVNAGIGLHDGEPTGT